MEIPFWVWPQSVAWVLVHGYLWWRLVRCAMPPGRWRKAATIALAVMAPTVPGALIAMHTLSPTEGAWITWPGFIWYGLLVYLLLALVAGELLRLVLFVARKIRRRGAEPETPEAVASRRRFLARGVAIGAGAVAVTTVGYGMTQAFSSARLERITIRLRGLADAGEGFRIALVADTHVGPFLGRGNISGIVERVNAEKPDVVVIPGDLIDGTVADLGPAVAPLGDLRARHGVYFSLGNHEYLFDFDNWVEYLRDLGIRTLRNERVELPHFDLAGVNDSSGDNVGDPPDYERALGDRDPDRPVVLLAHQPAQAYEAQKYGVDLQLSGHTHGGQFFPAGLLTSIGQPVMAGHGTVGDTQLYVTRGTGFWGPAIRVGSPPEITLITLAAAR
ncbi:metallophosphoesterase [Stackebrandtia nassauensis]|uniref:Metallophosphoesterase n=1 Tax=Stackebrandtia nassauensis (strain DSM 44728 / CIP 108903 / NRRL B-16338 / NBRC 102104 / LLR-40K-21) TaxID=446470 RepID=D3Q8V8_STANL|nr:metallophosphoesterase [Stackebrandtia nassauensis]ADD44550.1 metallophosphoesterase [Stackebrandtia nassauensis DSM 44728]